MIALQSDQSPPKSENIVSAQEKNLIGFPPVPPRLFDGSTYRSVLYPRHVEDDDYADETAGGYNDVFDEFRVYWNVPTFQCRKHGYNFTEVAEWGVRQNVGDDFRGDKISLLYDPGLFPALLQSGGSRGDHVVRNGGVPHEGDLAKHLQTFTEDLANRLVPDPGFSGERYARFATRRVKTTVRLSKKNSQNRPFHGVSGEGVFGWGGVAVRLGWGGGLNTNFSRKFHLFESRHRVTPTVRGLGRGSRG